MNMEPPASPNPRDQPPAAYDPELRAGGQLTSPTWELELFLSGGLLALCLYLFMIITIAVTALRLREPLIVLALLTMIIMGSFHTVLRHAHYWITFHIILSALGASLPRESGLDLIDNLRAKLIRFGKIPAEEPAARYNVMLDAYEKELSRKAH